jgi:ppGpp synthetase/RelA/SpoT-type nucleotidyltranferase
MGKAKTKPNCKTKFEATTNHQLLYGDLDKDGIHNLDDPRPFKRSKDKIPVTEISLTGELKQMDAHSKKVGKDLQTVVHQIQPMVPKDAKLEYRVKNVPSIVNKLRRKGLVNMGDLGGARIIAKDDTQLQKIRKKVEAKLKGKIVNTEDFYKHPKPGNEDYHAVHYDLQVGRSKMELQLKTKRIAAVTEAYHTSYKTGPTKTGEAKFKKMMNLAMKADAGDLKAQKTFDKLKITKKSFK